MREPIPIRHVLGAPRSRGFYNQNSKTVEIIIERLPRLKTDQTSAIIALPVQNTLEVMVPLVSKVEPPST